MTGRSRRSVVAGTAVMATARAGRTGRVGAAQPAGVPSMPVPASAFACRRVLIMHALLWSTGCRSFKTIITFVHERYVHILVTFPPKRQMNEETFFMKAIVVTDQTAGTAGM